MMDTGDGARTRGRWGRADDGEINEGVESFDGGKGTDAKLLLEPVLLAGAVKLGLKRTTNLLF